MSSPKPSPYLSSAITALLLILSSLLSLPASAGDPPAIHGMLVFGKKSVYLSHLPMFHSPHDYQVILKADLGTTATQTYLSDQRSHPDMIYTFVPEPMVLPDVVHGMKPFQGDLYRGHFERGGTVILAGVHVSIEKVLYFRKFNPAEHRPSTISYLLFGKPGDFWLAHQISVKPDFDQIVSVQSPSSAPLGNDILPIQVASVPADQPLQDGRSYDVESAGGELHLSDLRTDYLEFGDLSM